MKRRFLRNLCKGYFVGHKLPARCAVGVLIEPANRLIVKIHIEFIPRQILLHLNPQMLIHRVFGDLTVKLLAGHFCVHNRELRVEQPYCGIIERQHLVFVRTDIHRITQVIFVAVLGSVGGSWFTLQNLADSGFLGALLTDFLLVRQLLRIDFLFLWVKVSVIAHELSNTPQNLIPRQRDLGAVIILTEMKPLAVMVYRIANA